MAKQRWLVRERADHVGVIPAYRVYEGRKPARTKSGEWPWRRLYERAFKQTAEAFCSVHLEPGGGPVLLGCW